MLLHLKCFVVTGYVIIQNILIKIKADQYRIVKTNVDIRWYLVTPVYQSILRKHEPISLIFILFYYLITYLQLSNCSHQIAESPLVDKLRNINTQHGWRVFLLYLLYLFHFHSLVIINVISDGTSLCSGLYICLTPRAASGRTSCIKNCQIKYAEVTAVW